MACCERWSTQQRLCVLMESPPPRSPPSLSLLHTASPQRRPPHHTPLPPSPPLTHHRRRCLSAWRWRQLERTIAVRSDKRRESPRRACDVVQCSVDRGSVCVALVVHGGRRRWRRNRTAHGRVRARARRGTRGALSTARSAASLGCVGLGRHALAQRAHLEATPRRGRGARADARGCSGARAAWLARGLR